MTGGAHRLDDEVTSIETEVSALARAVALKRAVITSVVGGLLMLALTMGWIDPDTSAHVTGGIETGLGVLTTIGAGAWIHRGTTPADQQLQPRNSDGQPLVPDSSVADALGLGDGSPELAAALTDPIPGDNE